MQKRIIQIICLTIGFSQNTIATVSTTSVSECPGVILCHSGDTSKQTRTASEEDEKASQCYFNAGDREMGNIASNAMIRCKTMYGSINPTIRKN